MLVLYACACMDACVHACLRVCALCAHTQSTCVFLTFACHWTRCHDSLRLTMCVRECWRQGNLVYAYMLQPSLGHDVSEIYSLLQHQLSPGAPRLPQHSGKRSLRGQRFGICSRHGSTDSRRCATCKAWVAPSEPDRTLGSGHSEPSVLSTQLGGSVCRGCIR